MTGSKKKEEESKESAEHVHGPHCHHSHHEKPKPIVREGVRIGRNDPCSCGSQKKFKKCCGQ